MVIPTLIKVEIDSEGRHLFNDKGILLIYPCIIEEKDIEYKIVIDSPNLKQHVYFATERCSSIAMVTFLSGSRFMRKGHNIFDVRNHRPDIYRIMGRKEPKDVKLWMDGLNAKDKSKRVITDDPEEDVTPLVEESEEPELESVDPITNKSELMMLLEKLREIKEDEKLNASKFLLIYSKIFEDNKLDDFVTLFIENNQLIKSFQYNGLTLVLVIMKSPSRCDETIGSLTYKTTKPSIFLIAGVSRWNTFKERIKNLEGVDTTFLSLLEDMTSQTKDEPTLGSKAGVTTPVMTPVQSGEALDAPAQPNGILATQAQSNTSKPSGVYVRT